MKKVYDFSKGKRGAVIPTTGKTRITIYVDDAVIKRFKAQTLINDALKSHLGLNEQPITQELVRKIVREELAATG
jgi:GDP-D-mannose dehydratase